MKKKYLLTSIILSLIIIFTGNTYAVTNQVSIKASKTELTEKEEFNIIISAQSGDDVSINGISATLKYDENILEMVSSEIIDNTNWSNLGEFPNLVALWLPSTSETSSADIYKITFKVKEGISSTNTKIELTDILLSTSNNDIIVEDIAETVQINKKENNTDDNNKDENNTDENNKNDDIDNNNKNNAENDNKLINSTSIKSERITSNSKLPYTGEIFNIIIISIAVLIVLFGVRGYFLYKKYKGI